MKKNIAVIAGGYSSEHTVSLRSAEELYSFIDADKYNIYRVFIERTGWFVHCNGITIPIDKNDFSFKCKESKIRFDFAYITIHGTPGENGLLQGYLEMLQIPYSTCNTLVSALTFNKYVCNRFLKSQGILVSDAIRIRKGETIDAEKIIDQLGLPVFVKPNDCGSSFGVTKVKALSGMLSAISRAFEEGLEVIVERFIPGTEVTCGCYKIKGKEVVFPLTEVVTENDFFDYNAKYKGQSQEITPARIPVNVAKWIQKETSRIYDLIGAKGIIRIDYIIPSDRLPVMLEINTTPGMTAESFIPQQIRAAQLDIKEVMTDIIENELKEVIKKTN